MSKPRLLTQTRLYGYMEVWKEGNYDCEDDPDD